MIFVRKIDANGMFLEDAFVGELTSLTIETPCPQGFYRPKWYGEKWVEGLSQVEIDAIKANDPLPAPTIEELTAVVADMTQLLADKGVIY